MQAVGGGVLLIVSEVGGKGVYLRLVTPRINGKWLQ